MMRSWSARFCASGRAGTDQPSTAVAWPLEYRFAFDLAAATLFGHAASVPRTALLASAPSFVSEWLLRAADPPTIIADFEPVETTVRLIAAARMTTARVVEAKELGDAPGPYGQALTGVLWASPRSETWRALVGMLDGMLETGARAVILTAGPLRPLLAAIRRGWRPGEPRYPIRDIDREIGRRGFSLEETFTIGGPEAIRWSTLSRVARLLGRSDLIDRYEAGYQLALAPRRGHRVGVNTVIVARKEGTAT